METLLWIISLLVFFCLLYLRITVVIDEWKTWNYHCYRYKSFCQIQYSEEEKPSCDVEQNVVNKAECILVIIMFWKLWPERFFDFKPDWHEIHEKYYLKKV